MAINLKDVDHADFYAGFLKSSAKITLYPTASKRTSAAADSSFPSALGNYDQESPNRSYASSPAPRPNATWVCPICSFSNPIPANFDPTSANSRTLLPPCQTCGIKPPLLHLVKVAIASISHRQTETASSSPGPGCKATQKSFGSASSNVQCPRCTFENHPSLLACEICGASLVVASNTKLDLDKTMPSRADSPSPMLRDISLADETRDSIKFSFRAGGERVFYERLKGALLQRKWLLQSAPPIPKPTQLLHNANNKPNDLAAAGERQKMVGIAGLELRGQELRKNNEMIIGNAFEDLEALMTSAKEVIALAEQFSHQTKETAGPNAEADHLISQSASALGLATTKDMLGSDSLYISELSRNLAEFLTDDTKGILKREGGIMSLVDLWAVFNRARGGVELVSPTDFEKAAQTWDKLKLPVRLRRFKSGLLVVQGRDRTDDKTVGSILSWMRELHVQPPPDGEDVRWDWRLYGRGVTVQEVAARFGWSVGVASEELEMAEEKGALCREPRLDGLRFWENWLVQMPPGQVS